MDEERRRRGEEKRGEEKRRLEKRRCIRIAGGVDAWGSWGVGHVLETQGGRGHVLETKGGRG